MNHFVPDFDDNYVNVNPNSSSSSSPNLDRKSLMRGEEDDLMELLWQNGQVVLHNQRPKPSSPSKPHSSGVQVALSPPPLPLHKQQQQPDHDQNLFIQEDEMTSWLHYPLRDDDFCSDLIFSSASQPQQSVSIAPSAPPVTLAKPPTPMPSVRPAVRNFMNFSKLRGECGRPKAIVRESMQVNPTVVNVSERSLKGKEVATVQDETMSSSAVVSEIPGTSSSVISKTVTIQPEPENRIDEDTEETECQREDTKQARGSKRSRAAQVHNLSERKRRDRINERMKALQELIPRCNKSDKASMLDEAIEYMKSLQLQIQMMSVGCGMMPMMYTGMQQQYMPHIPMGMNRPPPPPPPTHPSYMPFSNMYATQGPLPPMSGYPDPLRVYVPNQQFDPTLGHPRCMGYMDPYQQQFRNLHPGQASQFQNQETSHPSSSRVSSNKESEDRGNQTTG